MRSGNVQMVGKALNPDGPRPLKATDREQNGEFRATQTDRPRDSAPERLHAGGGGEEFSDEFAKLGIAELRRSRDLSLRYGFFSVGWMRRPKRVGHWFQCYGITAVMAFAGCLNICSAHGQRRRTLALQLIGKLCNHTCVSPASKIRPCYEPVMSISLPCATAVASTTAANGWPTSPPIRPFATLHDHSPAFMIASAKPSTSLRCRSSKMENDRRRGSVCPNHARDSNNARSATGASPNGLMGCSGAPPTMCRRSSAAWRWCPNYSKQTEKGLAGTLSTTSMI